MERYRRGAVSFLRWHKHKSNAIGYHFRFQLHFEGYPKHGAYADVAGYLRRLGVVPLVLLYSKERIVCASQPEFLYILCAEAALMVLSLFFISFDESKDWSQDKLSRACQVFP
jgi:hypothetical protein